MRIHMFTRAALMTALLLTPLAAPAQTTASPAETRYQPFPTIWSGVYANEEADRGQQTAARLCGRCHGPDLRGTSQAPRLTGAAFFDRWHDLMMLDVIAWIQSAMPGNHAFFVPAKETREVVAYMLRESGVPAGREPISTDMDVLSHLLILRKPN